MGVPPPGRRDGPPRRVVIALGGNALLRRGEPLEADVQRHNVKQAATAVANAAREHQVVITHGNGPQVGLLALQSESYREVRPYPLDVLGAESEGLIGYMLDQELVNELPGRDIVTLLTQVIVDPADPGFRTPTKPVGPIYAEAEATRLAAQRGWAIVRADGGFRRVVPSPEPKRIIELPAIRLLVDAGALVICAGGGGIPVAIDEVGAIRGVEAVIDKDLSAALLATQLQADVLLLLTDVAAVYTDWGTAQARPIRGATPPALRQHRFEAGSMGPKVEAACRFVEATGATAAIGALGDATAILNGAAGTVVRSGRTI